VTRARHLNPHSAPDYCTILAIHGRVALRVGSGGVCTMKRAGRVGGGPRSKPSTMIGQRMQRASECRCSASRAPLSLLSALQTQKEKRASAGWQGGSRSPKLTNDTVTGCSFKSRRPSPSRGLLKHTPFVGNYYAWLERCQSSSGLCSGSSDGCWGWMASA
jgi:hypothetical protein